MNYIAVRGQGDPNQEDGAYKQAILVRKIAGMDHDASENTALINA